MRFRSPRFVSVIALLVVLAPALVVILTPRPARAQDMAYWIFVTLPNEDQVAAIDFETLAVTHFPVTGFARQAGPNKPWGIGAAPTAGAVVAILNGSNSLAVLFPVLGQIASFPVGSRPTNGEIDRIDPNTGFIALQGASSIQKAGASGPGPVVKLSGVKKPWDVAISTSNLVVGGKKGVSLIAPADFARGVYRIAVDIKGKDVRSVDCDSTGDTCAATDFKLNVLKIFDPATGEVMTSIDLRKHKGPYGVDFDPTDDDKLVVASNRKKKLLCIDTGTMPPTMQETKVGKGPTEVEHIGTTGYVVVANSKSTTVSIVDKKKGACATSMTIDVGGKPQDVAILPKS